MLSFLSFLLLFEASVFTLNHKAFIVFNYCWAEICAIGDCPCKESANDLVGKMELSGKVNRVVTYISLLVMSREVIYPLGENVEG